MVCICEHSLVYQQIECDFVGTFNTQHLNSQFHACEFNFVVVVVVDVAVFVDFFVLLYSFHSSYCFIQFSCAFSCVGKIPIAFVEAQNTFHSNYHFRFDQRKIVSIEIAHHREKIQQKFSKNWSSVNEMNTTLTVLLIKLCVENLSHSARQTITTTNNIYIHIYMH